MHVRQLSFAALFTNLLLVYFLMMSICRSCSFCGLSLIFWLGLRLVFVSTWFYSRQDVGMRTALPNSMLAFVSSFDVAPMTLSRSNMIDWRHDLFQFWQPWSNSIFYLIFMTDLRSMKIDSQWLMTIDFQSLKVACCFWNLEKLQAADSNLLPQKCSNFWWINDFCRICDGDCLYWGCHDFIVECGDQRCSSARRRSRGCGRKNSSGNIQSFWLQSEMQAKRLGIIYTIFQSWSLSENHTKIVFLRNRKYFASPG